ncbi:hypothetical protein [Falsiroseomonas selenitidurans]|uniref:Uncharacterized protein n=1 Tax=Falsiroseomonas selenitidurans TaxID=2716335 RepID=A0ABX1E2H2_9PROT|nr:hypothetical protein [Falsiroseomonas selenitidurans]NKC31369.1 hypothetical protein [Falsiroseomonas selenitidurans]
MLDLSPDRLAATLAEAGLQHAQAARMREAAGPFLARLDADSRLFGEYLVEEIARLSAEVQAMAQLQQAEALSRAERLRIDPLPFIPAARQDAAAGPAPQPESGPFAADVASEDFIGFGWYPAEPTDAGALRWSGAGRCATVQLPGLGGGQLAVTLALRAPFGVELDLGEQDVFLDGMKLELEVLSRDGPVSVCRGTAILGPLPAGSRVALLLQGARYADPATGPLRDTRQLGLGLGWVRIERAA